MNACMHAHHAERARPSLIVSQLVNYMSNVVKLLACINLYVRQTERNRVSNLLRNYEEQKDNYNILQLLHNASFAINLDTAKNTEGKNACINTVYKDLSLTHTHTPL